MIRPRLKMARQAITQQAQQGGSQPGMRDAPRVANQSNQGPAPTTQGRARAIYRPGPTAGSAQGPAGGVGTAPAGHSGSNRAGMPGFQTLAFQPVTRPGGISGGPTGVTMENAGDKLSEWVDRGYTGATEVPGDPNDLPGQMNPEDTTWGDTGAEYADGTEGYEANKSEEELIADMVRQYLEGVGNIDTTEQEALINEQMQEKLAMDLMNQRAAAGASGFEASGSLVGMEGDIRRSAARDATGARLDARQQAEEDAFGRAMGVADLSANERKMAFEEWKAQQQMDALNRWLESQGAEGAGGEGGGPLLDQDGDGDVDMDDAQAAADAYGYVMDPDTADARRENEQRGRMLNSRVVDSPPPGYVKQHSEGGIDYYQDPYTFQWVQVRSSAAGTGTDTGSFGGQARGGGNGGAAAYNPEG